MILIMSRKFLKDPNRSPLLARHRATGVPQVYTRVNRQEASKTSPRRSKTPQDPSKTVQDAFKTAQAETKTLQEAFKSRQDRQNDPQDASKTGF